jgi:sugar fermentation stimulation protein A
MGKLSIRSSSSPHIVEAHFLSRESRFSAFVSIEGEDKYVHVPNSGRLEELLVRGARVFVVPAPAQTDRKTEGDLVLVESGNSLVSIDARRPKTILSDAIARGQLLEFRGWDVKGHEPSYGSGRFDVLIGPQCTAQARRDAGYVETKSVTLVAEGRALFPDAPTERGARHLKELREAAGEGFRAAVVFIVQRPDAHTFSPNVDTDPGFACALKAAQKGGVEVYAYACEVSFQDITLAERLELLIHSPKKEANAQAERWKNAPVT